MDSDIITYFFQTTPELLEILPSRYIAALDTMDLDLSVFAIEGLESPLREFVSAPVPAQVRRERPYDATTDFERREPSVTSLNGYATSASSNGIETFTGWKSSSDEGKCGDELGETAFSDGVERQKVNKPGYNGMRQDVNSETVSSDGIGSSVNLGCQTQADQPSGLDTSKKKQKVNSRPRNKEKRKRRNAPTESRRKGSSGIRNRNSTLKQQSDRRKELEALSHILFPSGSSVTLSVASESNVRRSQVKR